ncbi:MAG: cell envelope integrity protein TolA, partial [Comamonadaceae bacterium]
VAEKAAAEKAAAEKAAAQKAAAEKAAAQKEAAEKEAAEKAAATKAAAEKAAAEKAAAQKAAAAKEAAEKKAKAEAAAKQAAADKALRDSFRDAALGAAGIPGGTADRNQAGGGRDSGYGAKVRACVQPRVNYPTPPRSGAGNPEAKYQIQLGSDGAVSRVTLSRSSGNTGFDDAVERGIRACRPFPRPTTGESVIEVNYRMYD